MSYEFYKILHSIGFALLFGSLGMLTARAMAGVPWTAPGKKFAVSLHGVALLLLLVSGFGLLAKLGIMANFPGWAGVKLGIWLLLGAAIVLFKRRGANASTWFWAAIALASLAAYLARVKPF